ncbi:ribonuclease E/G [Acetobacter vaccinii]|uniref:ribonuclease E/G n=1 Tax=Acetobacter vaccinii TaxID=2592655 RepID=UPI001FF0050C|nr:ribonuclease E/G [Acetobacter vaccinii]
MAGVTTLLHIASSPGEMRLAVSDHSVLVDFALWRPGAPDGVGDLYSGRITTLVPSMGGAFVQIGLEAEGFMPLPQGSPALTEGQSITTRITRAAQGGKGVRLALVDTTPAAAPGTRLAPGPTPLDRLAAQWPQANICVDTPAAAARIPHSLRARRLPGFAPPPEDIISACEALEEDDVSLPGGMRATITPTPALTAIDMDAPPTPGRAPKQTAQYAANRDALPALMRQIRLRNISGAILVDPAGLAARKRQALLEPTRAALEEDPLRPRCLGVTALGLIEIVRARIHPSLAELRNSPHGRALKALQHIVTSAPASTVLRGGSRIIQALEQDSEALADCRSQLGHPLALHLDPTLPDLHWTLHTP